MVGTRFWNFLEVYGEKQALLRGCPSIINAPVKTGVAWAGGVLAKNQTYYVPNREVGGPACAPAFSRRQNDFFSGHRDRTIQLREGAFSVDCN